MLKRLDILALSFLLTSGTALAQDFNDTQSSAGDLYSQAVIDNCTCPDTSDESDQFERCLSREERKVLKAGQKFTKYLDAASIDMKGYVEEALDSYKADCEASWDGDPTSDDPPSGESSH